MNRLLNGIILLFAASFELNAEDLLSADEEFLVEGQDTYFNIEQSNFEQTPQKERTDDTNFLKVLKSHSVIYLATNILQNNNTDTHRTSLNVNHSHSWIDNTYIKLDAEVQHIHRQDKLAKNHGESYWHSEVSEAWVQYTPNNCNAKLGRQHLFWGEIEGAFVADVISPLDLTKPLLTDYSSIRLAQDMVVANCFLDTHNLEIFVAPKPKLNKTSHKNNSVLKSYEKRLSTEYGLKYSISRKDHDISFIAARLNENAPAQLVNATNLELLIPKQNILAISNVWSFEQILFEADIAYKTNQLKYQSYQTNEDAQTENQTEAALGFEYLTNSNHQINAGIWFNKTRTLNSNQTNKWNQQYSITWSKDYLNDNLNLNALLNWSKTNDSLISSVQAGYRWTDSIFTSAALLVEDNLLQAGSANEQVSVYLNGEFYF